MSLEVTPPRPLLPEMCPGGNDPPTPLIALSSAFFSGGAQNVGSPTLNFRCFFAIFLDFHRTNFFQILPDLSRLWYPRLQASPTPENARACRATRPARRRLHRRAPDRRSQIRQLRC